MKSSGRLVSLGVESHCYLILRTATAIVGSGECMPMSLMGDDGVGCRCQ
jgi:hypothetical protein